MRDDYIAEYNGCDCGSTTYGWIVYRYDVSLGKRIKGIECGGCGKFKQAQQISVKVIEN